MFDIFRPLLTASILMLVVSIAMPGIAKVVDKYDQKMYQQVAMVQM